jgi:hypothetical protein
MTPLSFTRSGKMHTATEGPYRFVLTEGGKPSKGWTGEIFLVERRRGPAWLAGHFSTRVQALAWFDRYRKPDVEAAS